MSDSLYIVPPPVDTDDRLFDVLAQDLLQLRDNRVTHLLGASAATDVLGPGAVVDGVLHGLLDRVGLLGEAERVPQHHGDRQDGADGVDDALARDIGCRA